MSLHPRYNTDPNLNREHVVFFCAMKRISIQNLKCVTPQERGGKVKIVYNKVYLHQKVHTADQRF
jgi:hypothetical protein